MDSKDKLSTIERANQLVKNIKSSGISIYHNIEVGDPNLWIPSEELELLLNEELCGLDLGDLPNRTRSKTVKSLICTALGYEVPKTFKKVQPRFTGQNFDVYTQKSNNFQPWNEGIVPSRRYVLVRPNKENIITRVKVVSGDMLAALDKTGKLTTKFQAQLNKGTETSELITPKDTLGLQNFVKNEIKIPTDVKPTDYPSTDLLLSVSAIYNQLVQLIGIRFEAGKKDQERNRGAIIHKLVCQALGYSSYKDDGRFPDVKHQLLEVKLQTSPTIDLGLFKPSDENALDIPQLGDQVVRLCDVRYAIFYGVIEDGILKITNFYLTTGESFFNRFPQCQGNVQNSKLQIPLKKNFFD